MTGLEKIGNVLDFLQMITYKHNIFETSGKLGFRDGV